MKVRKRYAVVLQLFFYICLHYIICNMNLLKYFFFSLLHTRSHFFLPFTGSFTATIFKSKRSRWFLEFHGIYVLMYR